MMYRLKKKLRDKSTMACGLLTILKDEIDMMRSDANEYDLTNLNSSVKDVLETLDKLSDVIGEIEYVLYLERRNAELRDPERP